MRFWEIDLVRGAAVVLMVLFNWSFALQYLGVIQSDGNWLYWWLFPRAIASVFIFVAGISLSISYAKNSDTKKHLKRGGKIFVIGLAITAVTLFYTPQDFIVFGILHLIGASIIISTLLMKQRSENLATLGIVIFSVGMILDVVRFNFPYLVWLGFMHAGFRSLDYFPILPWFGIFIFGMIFGRRFYGKRRKIKDRPNLLSLIGRHSLAIYIIHQPVLLAALHILGLL